MDEKWKKYLLAAFLVFVFLSFTASLGGWSGIVISGIAGWQMGDWSLLLAEKLLAKQS